MTPGLPNGSTATRIISQRVAPRASAASLLGSGVWSNTSRLMAVTIGRIMMASTIDARNTVPCETPVLPNSGIQPNAVSIQVRTDESGPAMTGPRTRMPQRP